MNEYIIFKFESYIMLNFKHTKKMVSNQSFCECEKLDMDNSDTFKYCCQDKVNEGSGP